jgi:hypothetical protein
VTKWFRRRRCPLDAALQRDKLAPHADQGGENLRGRWLTHPRTGRPLDERGRPAVRVLSDAELEAELTTAAAAPDHDRFEHFLTLLRERARRRGEQALTA